MVIINQKDHSKKKIRIAIFSLFLSFILFGAKFAAYLLTDSTAILSDALESIINISTALFTVISLIIAAKPADQEHPYGHGKVEFISAGFVGAAILGAAVLIIYKVISNFVVHPELERLGYGLVLISGATVINLVMGIYLIHIGKKTNSISLEADGRHLLTDVKTSIGVIIGIILIKLTGIKALDSIVAVLVALNITWVGLKLLKKAFGGMMDAADKEDVELIERILNDPGIRLNICGYHRLRARKSGGKAFVDFHLLMPRNTNIQVAHKIATAVEGKIAIALHDAGVMAHIEPCKERHCKNCMMEKCEMRSSSHGSEGRNSF